jgi:hypothetical protein
MHSDQSSKDGAQFSPQTYLYTVSVSETGARQTGHWQCWDAAIDEAQPSQRQWPQGTSAAHRAGTSRQMGQVDGDGPGAGAPAGAAEGWEKTLA